MLGWLTNDKRCMKALRKLTEEETRGAKGWYEAVTLQHYMRLQGISAINILLKAGIDNGRRRCRRQSSVCLRALRHCLF